MVTLEVLRDSALIGECALPIHQLVACFGRSQTLLPVLIGCGCGKALQEQSPHTTVMLDRCSISSNVCHVPFGDNGTSPDHKRKRRKQQNMLFQILFFFLYIGPPISFCQYHSLNITQASCHSVNISRTHVAEYHSCSKRLRKTIHTLRYHSLNITH